MSPKRHARNRSARVVKLKATRQEVSGPIPVCIL